MAGSFSSQRLSGGLAVVRVPQQLGGLVDDRQLLRDVEETSEVDVRAWAVSGEPAGAVIGPHDPAVLGGKVAGR